MVLLMAMPCIFSCSRLKPPSDADLVDYAKAAALYAQGRFPQAATAAADLAMRAPEFSAAGVLAGKASYFSGDAKAAIVALERAMKGKTANREAGIWLSRALRSAGEREKASLLVDELLSCDSEDWRVLSLASQLRADSGDSSGERAFLDRALDSGSGLGLVFMERARFRYASGNLDGARKDLLSALAVLSEGSSAFLAARGILDEIENRNALVKKVSP
jgi:tetratricopeptide (TPR) repeat protein